MTGNPTSNGDNEYSNRVHEAAGMVSAQIGCSVAEALDRLKQRADVTCERVEDVAVDVIHRIIRFEA